MPLFIFWKIFLVPFFSQIREFSIREFPLSLSSFAFVRFYSTQELFFSNNFLRFTRISIFCTRVLQIHERCVLSNLMIRVEWTANALWQAFSFVCTMGEFHDGKFKLWGVAKARLKLQRGQSHEFFPMVQFQCQFFNFFFFCNVGLLFFLQFFMSFCSFFEIGSFCVRFRLFSNPLWIKISL